MAAGALIVKLKPSTTFSNARSFRGALRILTLFLCAAIAVRLNAASLAIVEAGVEQSEDAPFVTSSYQFLPGDYLYFMFQIAGFAIRAEERDEVRKISLEYDVTPQDANGVPLTPAASGSIAAQIGNEDKDWTPKRRVSFLIPSFVAAGDYHVHVHVKDLIGKIETSEDIPFRIGGVAIQPAKSITVENFHFYRSQNDTEPLEVAAYSPGDNVFARFDMAGYKINPQNEYHVSYGLTVLRPDGKPFVDKPTAAELQSASFYPAQYVPGVIDLKTSKDMERGEYIIVLTVRDAFGQTTSEFKQAFSIE